MKGLGAQRRAYETFLLDGEDTASHGFDERVLSGSEAKETDGPVTSPKHMLPVLLKASHFKSGIGEARFRILQPPARREQV